MGLKTTFEEPFNLDELDSSHILDLLPIKADEPLIRKALEKSAKYLIQIPPYNDLGTDFTDVEGRDSLVHIFETYLKIPSITKQEKIT